MHTSRLKAARMSAGLTQQQAAERLEVSQGYWALLENGQRRLTEELAMKAVGLLDLQPTLLPLEGASAADSTPESLAKTLAALGYPGFSHLRGGEKQNPAGVVLLALRLDDVDRRTVEALPWVVSAFADLDWDWTVQQAKLADVQNRLGFVVNLARRVAELRGGAPTTVTVLSDVEARLEKARLVREDTLCQASLTNAQRKWLREARPAEAEHWNLLTGLRPEHLSYAA